MFNSSHESIHNQVALRGMDGKICNCNIHLIKYYKFKIVHKITSFFFFLMKIRSHHLKWHGTMFIICFFFFFFFLIKFYYSIYDSISPFPCMHKRSTTRNVIREKANYAFCLSIINVLNKMMDMSHLLSQCQNYNLTIYLLCIQHTKKYKWNYNSLAMVLGKPWQSP